MRYPPNSPGWNLVGHDLGGGLGRGEEVVQRGLSRRPLRLHTSRAHNLTDRESLYSTLDASKMLSLQSFLRKGVSLGYVGRNYNLKDLKDPDFSLRTSRVQNLFVFRGLGIRVCGLGCSAQGVGCRV